MGMNDRADVAFAAGAAAMWAAYIVFSARVGARFPQAGGLALAMACAAVLTLPWGLAASGEEKPPEAINTRARASRALNSRRTWQPFWPGR